MTTTAAWFDLQARLFLLGALTALASAGCGDSKASGASPGSGATTAAAVATSATTAAAPASTTSAAPDPSASSTGTTAAAAGAAGCPEGMVVVPYASGLCMSKTEVTVAQFRKCVDDGKCKYTKPVNPECNWLDGSKGNHPMNCAGRTQAEGYCKAQGGRLPSVEEWEFASRDGEAKPYAWGTADPQKEGDDKYWCWSGKAKRSGTCEVGSFPAGATKSGLLDMSGNVAEWATGGDVDEKSKTCGRAFDATEGWKAMEKCPGGYFAEAQIPVIGFRCVAPKK